MIPCSQKRKRENVPTQGLCVLWIYIDVYMFPLPISWSVCSCLQWPKKMLRGFCYDTMVHFCNADLIIEQSWAGHGGRGLLTKYFPSDEMAIHRIWAVCPTCRSSVPFLPPGIMWSFFPLSTSPEDIWKTLNWNCQIRSLASAASVRFTFIHISYFPQKCHACFSEVSKTKDFRDFNVYQHLIMEQSLAAEKMYLSSEVMTKQVIGSLCPLNTLISEASGGTS